MKLDSVITYSLAYHLSNHHACFEKGSQAAKYFHRIVSVAPQAEERQHRFTRARAKSLDLVRFWCSPLVTSLDALV